MKEWSPVTVVDVLDIGQATEEDLLTVNWCSQRVNQKSLFMAFLGNASQAFSQLGNYIG